MPFVKPIWKGCNLICAQPLSSPGCTVWVATYAPSGGASPMLYPFFALAAQSPTRQAAFRRVGTAHLSLLLGGVWVMYGQRPGASGSLLGHLLLVAGIVEGAVLVGWRLTQLPKSQALEFLLASPLRPRRVLLAEALVGLTQLALVTLA